MQLEYDPKLNKTNEYTHAMLGVKPEELSAQRWKSFAHHWRSYNEASTPTQAQCFHMNEVFANRSDENKIYPLTTAEITAAQWADAFLKHLFNSLTPKSVPAGTKLVLFGRYVLIIYVGIV